MARVKARAWARDQARARVKARALVGPLICKPVHGQARESLPCPRTHPASSLETLTSTTSSASGRDLEAN